MYNLGGEDLDENDPEMILHRGYLEQMKKEEELEDQMRAEAIAMLAAMNAQAVEADAELEVEERPPSPPPLSRPGTARARVDAAMQRQQIADALTHTLNELGELTARRGEGPPAVVNLDGFGLESDSGLATGSAPTTTGPDIMTIED